MRHRSQQKQTHFKACIKDIPILKIFEKHLIDVKDWAAGPQLAHRTGTEIFLIVVNAKSFSSTLCSRHVSQGSHDGKILYFCIKSC